MFWVVGLIKIYYILRGDWPYEISTDMDNTLWFLTVHEVETDGNADDLRDDVDKDYYPIES